VATLRLNFLGPFQATLDGRLLHGFRSDKSRALLAYLAMQDGRLVARETVVGLFWGEDEEQAARSSLRQVLSNWRKLLAPLLAEDTPSLVIGRRTLQLHVDSDSVWVDAIHMQNLLDSCDERPHPALFACQSCHERMVKAVSLYQGDFLVNLQALNAGPQFDDWRLVQQEHYHQKVLHTLGLLAKSAQASGEREEEIAYLRRQLVMLPWLEQSHRALMAALADVGRRTEAIAQFETCRHLLSQEVGVEPSSETWALYREIVARQKDVSVGDTFIKHNLPPLKLSFVGRERELAHIDTLLADSTNRLLTLAGLGGVGKTSLALAAGRRQLARFRHGVWFVSLSDIQKGDAATDLDHTIALAVATQLQQNVTERERPFSQLQAFLQQKEMLLILDNVEQLLPEVVDFVLNLLNAAPGLRLIVTSQTPLNCQIETVILLGGLTLPETETAASVQLFVERVRRFQPAFQIDRNNAAHLHEICRLVTGLPLAIELAAELVNHYSLPEIATAVRANLDLLYSPKPDVPSRQHSIRAVLDYGWQFLTEVEKRALAQMSVFGDEFEREAVLAITDASLPHLVSLVDRTWLRLVRPGRYAIHGLVRQVAVDALEANPALKAETYAQFARFYAGFLERLAGNITTTNQVMALKAINAELIYLRQAWHWFMEQRDNAGLAVMMPGLSRFWDDQGRYWEGVQFFEEALRRAVQSGNWMVPDVHYHLVYWRAHFLYQHGRFDQARPILQKLHQTISPEQDPAYFAAATFDYANTLMEQGTDTITLPLQMFEEALRMYESQRDDNGAAAVLTRLGRYWETAGQYEKSHLAHQRSLFLWRKLGAPLQLGTALNTYALLLHRLGENETARELLQEAAALHRQTASQPELAAVLANSGLVETALGHYEVAEKHLKEAWEIQENQGNRSRIAIILNNLGDIANLQKNHQQALAYLDESLRIKQELNNERGMIFTLIHQGHAYWGLNRPDAAEKAYRQALQLATNLALRPLMLAALVGMAQILSCSDPVQALAWLQLPISHPASWQRVQKEAWAVAESLSAALSPEQVACGLSLGKGLDLAEVVEEIL
jgi:predicted ATPase/DNA-binding SARP family transcriptional activator